MKKKSKSSPKFKFKNLVKEPKELAELKKYEKIGMNSIFAVLWVAWGVIFLYARSTFSQVYVNWRALQDSVAMGLAVPIKGIGQDQSLVLATGVDMPAGSFRDVVPVLRSVGTSYYVPDKALVVSPLDLPSLVHMSLNTLPMLAVTVAFLVTLMLAANRSMDFPNMRAYKSLGHLPGLFARISVIAVPVLALLTVLTWGATML